MTEGVDYKVEENQFGRFIIIHPTRFGFAWTGATWDKHYRGIPTGLAQIANFNSADNANEYARLCIDRIKAAECTRD